MDLNVPKLRKLVHNGKVRNLNSEENVRIAAAIGECIDRMIEHGAPLDFQSAPVPLLPELGLTEIRDILQRTDERQRMVAVMHTDTLRCIRSKDSNLEASRGYVAEYCRAKRLFTVGSRDGLFPRLYAYKGVVFTWVDIRDIVPMTL